MAKKKTAAARKKTKTAAAAAEASQSRTSSRNSFAYHSDDSEASSATYTNGSTSANAQDGPKESPSTSLGNFHFAMDLDDKTPSQKAELKKAAGNERFKAGAYGSAVDLYSEAIALDVDEPSYYTNRAAAYMALKRYTPALADCQRAASLQAGFPQAKTLTRLARCQIALGQLDEASRTLAEALQVEPSNAQARGDQSKIESIRTHVANINREKAKKEWTYVLYGLDSLEREVDSPPLAWRVIKVEALLGKKRVEDASSLASDLLRSNPSDPDVLWVRGLVLFAQGNSAQAIAHAQAALRNDPDHAPAKNLLKRTRMIDSTKEAGNDSFKRGAWRDAIDKYSECLNALEAGDEAVRITLLSNRATAYLKAGQHGQAISDADEILAKEPKHFKGLRTRARAHLAQDSYEAAIADFAAAFQEAPAGSAEERAMKTEHRQAEVALKRSKTKDYYKILGVERTATDIEIKKAYRKQSLIHHPDKGGDEEKFKECQEAHSVLSDSTKRQRYDMGEDDLDSPMGGGFSSHPFAHAGGFQQFHGGSFGGSPYGFQSGGFNMEDFLGGGNRGFRSSFG